MPKPKKNERKRENGVRSSNTGRKKRKKKKSAVNGQTVVASDGQTQGK